MSDVFEDREGVPMPAELTFVPTSDPMVDRVAQIIWAVELYPARTSATLAAIEAHWPDQFAPELVEKYRAIARAAIEAMREPTEEMLAAEVAAYNAMTGKKVTRVGHALWQAMIDAALK